MRRSVTLLLNLAHAIDHLFLLVFATAVASIAREFGFARWEDLMPFGVGAFLLFGLGSLPAGRLGDLWGRRQMMVLFFFGIGISACLVALTQNAWQLAAALALVGVFASIYHPVGIPMLVQTAKSPGAAIGVNGLAGNLGIAAAAIVTGYLVEHIGWRAAFVLPGLATIVIGIWFIIAAPHETEPPARRARKTAMPLTRAEIARALAVMTLASASGGLIFNLTTNGNGQLLAERFRGVVEDPSTLGTLLGGVYALASLAQVIVGRLIDRFPLKPLQLAIVLCQVPMLWWASTAQGWALFAALLGTMAFVFGAIPFTDATIVRYVDDRMRSRVAGLRLAISLGISSAAVWALGPVVKAAGFGTLFAVMAGVAMFTAVVVLLLPAERRGAVSGLAPQSAAPPP